jgi:hypothetical protein
MNIIWIPRTAQYDSELVRRASVGFAVVLTALACSFTSSISEAQQISSLQHGGQTFPVVQASEMAGLLSMPSLQTPLTDFDSEISQVACVNGGRGNCRTGGTGGRNGNNCGSACGGCPTCQPYCYGRVEALMMRRQGLDNFTRSREFDLDDVDFEFAPRITIGTVPDCVSGTEVSFTGPFNWETSRSVQNVSGRTFLSERVPAVLGGGGGLADQDILYTMLYDPEQVGPVDDPDAPIAFQQQRYQSDYWSVEASKTSMAWDIAKLLFGARYISFSEEYSYVASDGPAAADNSFIFSDTTNDMIGLQVGIDMFTPICRNTSTYLRARAGGYFNMSEATTVVDDQAQRLYGIRDDDNSLAAMFELSNGVQYNLGEMLSIHGGSEIWYLAEVATAEAQLPGLVGARAPSRPIDSGDDVLFVGFSFGATLKY